MIYGNHTKILKMPKSTKRWQDKDKMSVLEKLLWFMLILMGCLYITHGHEIMNKIILDIIR